MKNVFINGVKILKKGVRVEGKYYPCWYSQCRMTDGIEAVTIYARCLLTGLPAALKPVNNTDMNTDYFEKDRARFNQGTPEYDALLPFVTKI